MSRRQGDLVDALVAVIDDAPLDEPHRAILIECAQQLVNYRMVIAARTPEGEPRDANVDHLIAKSHELRAKYGMV